MTFGGICYLYSHFGAPQFNTSVKEESMCHFKPLALGSGTKRDKTLVMYEQRLIFANKY